MYSNITLTGAAKIFKRFFASLVVLFFFSGSLQAQYCTAGATTADEIITNVTLGSINNSSTSVAGLYSNFSGQSTSALPGATVNFSVTFAPQYTGDVVAIWVDFNNNLVFTDAGENVFVSTASTSPASGSFTIPAGTAPGAKRVRIRLDYNNPAPSSCGSTTYGEVEDYTLNVISSVPCSGTPTPGNTLSTATSVCPGIPFTLSTQNNTAGSGVTYQYQSSATGAPGTFTNIGGATNSTYTVPTLSANTYYQVIVTCGGTATATSTPVLVSATPSSGCYCIPTGALNCGFSDVITNVTLGTLNNTSTCSAGGYTNYAGSTTLSVPQLEVGTPNVMKVTVGPGGTEYVGVWIDYNQNGSFLDAGEFTALGSANGATITGNVTVPAGATLGVTRMRVRVRYITALTAADACNATGTFGEVEDYNVQIIPCVPVTVTTQTTPQSVVCGGTATFTAALAGSSVSYQYQVQMTPGGAFVNITNNATYSGATTNTLTINNVTPSMSGYVYRIVYSNGCTSLTFTTPSALTVTPITATFTQSPTALCAGGTATQAITVTGGGTGVFTPTTGLFTDAAGTIPYTGGAVTVVYARPTATTTYSYVRTNGACVSGAVNVTVTVNQPISGFPFASVSGMTNICANGGTSITAGGISNGTGLTYQYQISTNGGATYTNIANGGIYSGATTPTLVISSGATLAQGTLIRVVVSSASCGTSLTSSPTTIVVNPTPVVSISTIPGGSTAPGVGSIISATVASGTGPYTYQFFVNNVAIGGPTTSSTINVDPNNTGNYSVTVTDARGCTASSTLSTTVNAIPSNVLFIYPSPNSGVFQVRYFNKSANRTATEPAAINVFDSKGSRVFTQRYSMTGPYTQMNVNMGTHNGGIYRVELTDGQGNRLQTGSVMIF